MISILNTAIWLAIAILLFLFRNDILWFIRAFKYIKQGISSRYYPLIGYAKYMDNPTSENGLEDWHKMILKKDDPTKSEPIILVNGWGSNPVLYVNDPKLAQEYYKGLNTKFTQPLNLAKFPWGDCFLFKFNERGHTQRGVINELFKMENLKKLTPEINKIILKRLGAIQKRVEEARTSDSQFAELALKEDIGNLYSDINSFVLFGEEAAIVEGLPVTIQAERVTNEFFMHSMTDFWHKLTGGLSTRLGLSAEHNRISKVHLAVHDEFKRMVNYRTNNKDYKRGLNMVDLMLNFNDRMEAEGRLDEVMTFQEIVDNIYLMIFAGVDTAKNLTLNCIQLLAQRQELQKRLRKTVQGEVFGHSSQKGACPDYDSFMDCELLDVFVNETLRLHGPSFTDTYHNVNKSFKLGEYKISKGTGIMVNFMSLRTKPEYFERPWNSI